MKKPCSPEDASLKSFFLGPQSENSDWVRQEVIRILDHWFRWRRDLFPEDGRAISVDDQTSPLFLERQDTFKDRIDELTRRLEKEIPQFSPRYMGHMYSEISLPALLGHFAVLLHNPNIISSEAARVAAQIENEAIEELAKMVGYNPSTATGHFTSGGTVANIEGLWRARYRMDHWLSLGTKLNLDRHSQLSLIDAAHMGWPLYDKLLRASGITEETLREFSSVAGQPWKLMRVLHSAFQIDYEGPVVLVPNSKHYSWQKATSLLGLGEEALWTIELDADGVMDVADLERKIKRAWDQMRPVLMVVSVAGTTELGEFDPVDQTQELLDRLLKETGRSIWHHVDAAYGGFFCTLLRGPQEFSELTRSAADRLAAISRANSITLDPHKLGYVPYSCGALLVPDDLHYRVSSFDAKYIQAPDKNDRWNRTLEGSRSASGAAATWMTAKTIGLEQNGYGRILGRTIHARNELETYLCSFTSRVHLMPTGNSNLLCFAVGEKNRLSELNSETEEFIQRLNASGRYFVSKTTLQASQYKALMDNACSSWRIENDCDHLTLVRLVIMNPFTKNQESLHRESRHSNARSEQLPPSLRHKSERARVLRMLFVKPEQRHSSGT